MKPLTPIGSPSPLRLLNKGPDYLRRQMESGNRERSISAVERLEADKAKYVKSQQVINTKQEPVIVPCATPPPIPRRPLTVPGASMSCMTPLRLPAAPYSAPGPLSLRDEDEQDAKKENCHAAEVEEHNHRNIGRAALNPDSLIAPLVAPHSAPILRRSTGKRMLRPDSLVMYRQKKECKPCSGGTRRGEVKNYSFVRRLFQGSMREKTCNGGSRKMTISEERTPSQDEESTPSRDEDSRMSWTNDRDTLAVNKGIKGSVKAECALVLSPSDTIERTKNSSINGTKNSMGSVSGTKNSVSGDPWKPAVPWRVGSLYRSKSDLCLRCSMALSEKERFFDYCGLDLEMLETLGLENFPSGCGSTDTLSLLLRSASGEAGGGSEASEFSRHSGDGLFQEELTEQLPSGVSIIERNARVIKWLYSCKNAVQEAPRESTV